MADWWDYPVEGLASAAGAVGGFFAAGPPGAIAGASLGYSVSSGLINASNSPPDPTAPPTTPNAADPSIAEAEEEEDRASSHGMAAALLGGDYSKGAGLFSQPSSARSMLTGR